MSITARPARPGDATALAALWRRFELASSGEAETDEAAVRLDWQAPGFDLERMTLVLEDGGEPVGYALTDDTGDADSVVDPERSGQGLEERILDWLEAPGTALQHFSQARDDAAVTRFTSRGWRPERTYWRMRLELDRPTPEPVWPTGVSVRSFDVDRDARVAYEVVETAFGDVGDDRRRRDFAEWAASMLAPERYDAELYLVAEQDGEVAGVCLSQVLPEAGFVRQLAVPAAQRGRGTGLALLHEVFRRHAARGVPATVLGVDAANATGATRLYERAGMRVHGEFTRWGRGPR